MRPTKPHKTKPTIRFSAKLFGHKPTKNTQSRIILTMPKNASARISTRGMTMIEGTINALPFRAALKPNNKGSQDLKINKPMQDALGLNAGETATAEITRVGEEPETRVPMDLAKALATTPPAQSSWTHITPLARRDWIFSKTTANQPETRIRRIEKARDMLASGKRRLCCFPGIKWLMKKNAKSCGMWLPLPNSRRK